MRSVWLAAALLAGAVACGGDDDSQSSPTTDAEESSPSPTVDEPSDLEPSEAESSDPEPSEAEPSEAEPSEAESSDPEPSEAEPSEAEPSEEDLGFVDGCGAEAVTDLSDVRTGRPVARCEPGAPAPIPLAERTQISVAAGGLGEFLTTFLLADALGEFDKENLDVEIQVLPAADQLVQIAAGRLDVGFFAFEPSFYGQFDEGIGVKAVLGSWRSPDDEASVPQQGIWARAEHFSDPSNPKVSELNGTTWGGRTAVPTPGTAMLMPRFVEEGLDASSLSWNVVGADVVPALENGAVAAAPVTSPFWSDLADNPEMVLLSPFAPWTTSGYAFGQRLLEDEPEVGRAFVRAMIRTINTYLSPTFKTDSPEAVAALAEALGVTPEQILSTPVIVQDWEVRAGSFDIIQEGYRILGLNDRETNIDESDLVDRSFVEAVLRGE